MIEKNGETNGAGWSELAELWNPPSSGAVPSPASDKTVAELVRRVRRRELRRRWTLIAELLIAGALLILMAAVLIPRGGTASWVALSYTVLATAAAVTFSIWSRRDVPLLDLVSSAAALHAARADLRSRSRALRFGWGLLVAHTLFFVLWLPRVSTGGTLGAYGFLLLWLTLFTLATLWLERRNRSESLELKRLEEELTEEEGDESR